MPNRSVTKNANCDNLFLLVTKKSVSRNVIKVMKKRRDSRRKFDQQIGFVPADLVVRLILKRNNRRRDFFSALANFW